MGGCAWLVYAAKDRIKEVGRQWIAGSLGRFFAQRVTRFRAPARMLSDRPVVLRARESFEQQTLLRPDSLNAESGAAVARTVIRFVQKGRVMPQPVLVEMGVHHVKQVFRYDVSPFFPRLHDPVKALAIVDPKTRTVHFTDAPRSYRAEVRVRLTYLGRAQEETAQVMLNKKGLVRLERPGELDVV